MLESATSIVDDHMTTPITRPDPTRSGTLRDAGPYSARNSSKGALVKEAHAVFSALKDGLSESEVKQSLLDGTLLANRTFLTRKRIWQALNWRYFLATPRWIREEIAQAAAGGPTDPRFVALLYYHYALRDRLTYEFVTGTFWDRWQRRSTQVSPADVLAFLDEAASREPQVKGWYESARRKLASNVLSALRDFGLLTGIQKKALRLPIVPVEVALHVARILRDEGLSGREIVASADWRLFLWSESDVRAALVQLDRRKLVRFDFSGRTAALEIPE